MSHHPIITRDLKAFLIPGMIVEVDPDEAEAMGAFVETALDEASAWESNIDLEGF